MWKYKLWHGILQLLRCSCGNLMHLPGHLVLLLPNCFMHLFSYHRLQKTQTYCMRTTAQVLTCITPATTKLNKMRSWQWLLQDKYCLADLLTPKYNKESRKWKWRYASGKRLSMKKKKATKKPTLAWQDIAYKKYYYAKHWCESSQHSLHFNSFPRIVILQVVNKHFFFLGTIYSFRTTQ